MTADAPASPAPTGWQRWLPQSLFGRLVLVLAGGLIVAQLLGAAISLADRENLVATAGGRQQAQRIADVVLLLDTLAPAERERVVAVLGVPPLVLTLHDAPPPATPGVDDGFAWRARIYQAMLRSALGERREIRVVADAVPDAVGPPPFAGGERWRGPGMMGAPGHMGRAGWGPGIRVVRTDVQLLDGRWARFDSAPPAAAATPWRLVLALAVLLVAALALSYGAVRWVTRPLHLLADAADRLGRDLRVAPLPETGPVEIRRAARAFNTMQARLTRFVEDRARVLAAMSHDLKTPLTRMRLRAELLDDAEARERFEADLGEMQAMVQQSLDFMRGLDGHEPSQPVDVDALLAALQAEQAAMGRTVRIEGRAAGAFDGVASLLKRGIGNLVDNAVAYGGEALVQVDDGPARLTLRVCDRGPGIAPEDRERVFEPFQRLESSRNRATGGTGLGLTIARDIARAHGGEITLHDRAGGGLEARLELPRSPA